MDDDQSSFVSAETARALSQEGHRVRNFIASNRSDTLLRLFDFLLKQSIEGRRPRETDIADEVFQGGSSEVGNQGSRVRVGVYRLRKKLDLFYVDTPGRRLTIPQGEYRFVIETPKPTTEEYEAPKKQAEISRGLGSAMLPAVALVILLNLLFALVYFRNIQGGDRSSGGQTLLSSFRDGRSATTVALGDYFMFVDKEKGGEVEEIVQDFSIDSADSFYEHVINKPEKRNVLINSDLYAVSSDTLEAISELSNHVNKSKVQFVTASEINPDIMKSSDIIYTGALDAISPLLKNPLFLASKFRCGTTCYELIDVPSGQRFLSDSPYLLGDRIVPRRDYGYIASYPGPSGNQILIVSGTGDAGVTQMVNVVTDPKRMAQLRGRIGGNFRSFEALYQVRTMFNRSYGSSLLIARPINSERIWDKTRRD